jgi:hypothetical protein
LIVTEADGHYEVQPSHPSIRLWPDSEAALLAHRPEPVLANAATPKARFPAGGPLAHCASPRPLKAVFFLEDGGASHIAIAALQPAEALVRLLSNTFQLDIEDKAALRRHFAAAARLCGHVPGFRLDYPRRYDVLGSVRDAIAGTVSGR